MSENLDDSIEVISESDIEVITEDLEAVGSISDTVKTGMFDWNAQSKKYKNKYNRYSDTDSDEDFTWCQKNHRKRHKNVHEVETNEMEESDGEAKDSLPEVSIEHQQMISGVTVKFPAKPYPCQLAVMSKVIQGCTKSQHCLLESPTGSGKTLALLCSVLAWHDNFTAEATKALDAMHKQVIEPMSFKDDEKNMAGCSSCMNLDDSFDGAGDCLFEEKKRLNVPKIYYGTRTHKQIEQVVRELKKTAYKHKKMTILSGREHSCIQNTTRSKTELCNELLDPANKGTFCRYYTENTKNIISSFEKAETRGLPSVWDIEDLVAIGRSEGACPYFAARDLMEHANIIFCPYNYLLNEDIREAMQLNLKGQIIILDEAHNIEDICRDSASVEFDVEELGAAITDCNGLANPKYLSDDTYITLVQYLTNVIKFLEDISLNKISNFDNELSSPYWTGAELLEVFNMHGLGKTTYPSFMNACLKVLADLAKAKDASLRDQKQNTPPVISVGTKITLEHFMYTMRMIMSEEHRNDFRACVTESVVKKPRQLALDKVYSVDKCEHRTRKLKLLCMNPGVTFSPLAKDARCILLASGTLTPIGSFQSELRAKFPHVLNAPHVIPKEQVYATCVPAGPNGVRLKANYENVNSWGFQDELGRVLLDICESVPHGVLCFFSSYRVMNTQMDRWKMNTTWDRITRIKQVFIEPRRAGDLGDIMRDYRIVIRDTSDGPCDEITGALFLAVLRGKVAEGIDFRDNEARCVVTVGIPYAVRKDPVIDMKIKYNDTNVSKGLLRGSEWYNIQAFRALNQALGRCLRHINDWGAVLLVDDRLLLSMNKENLPKWVKAMWTDQNGYNLKDELERFVARQKARENNRISF